MITINESPSTKIREGAESGACGTATVTIGKTFAQALTRPSRVMAAGATALALALSLSALPADLGPAPTVETAFAADQFQTGSIDKGATKSDGSAKKKVKVKAAATETVLAYSNGTYMFTSNYGGKCIDIPGSGTANNAAVKTWTNNSSMAQRFYVERQSNGIYTIQAGCSGKYLTDRSGVVVQQTKSTSSYQRWRFVKSGSYVLLKNVATGRYVTVGSSGNSASLTTKSKTGNSNQLFRMSASQLIKNGYYVLWSATGGRHLDVSAASRANNANVQIWTNNGTNAQKWYISHVGNGYYKIVNAASGKALDQVSTSKANGANVVQYTSGNYVNQYWYASISPNGGIVFVNKWSGRVLDVSGGTNRDGQNVQAWNRNDTAAQRWTPVATTKISAGSRTVYVGTSVREVTDYNGLKTVSIPDGCYTMRSNVGRMLDVAGNLAQSLP